MEKGLLVGYGLLGLMLTFSVYEFGFWLTSIVSICIFIVSIASRK